MVWSNRIAIAHLPIVWSSHCWDAGRAGEGAAQLRGGLATRRREGPQGREAGRQVCSLYLEEGLRLAQAAEPMRSQAPEAYAGWSRLAHGIPGRRRDQNLTAVSGRADPGDRVHGQADVARVGQRGAPAMDAGSESDIDTIRPGPSLYGPLDGMGNLERRRSAIEDREELIRASVDLAATRPVHGAPDDGADVGQQGGVPIAQSLEEAGRPFDIGQEERQVPGGQCPRFADLGFDLAAQPLVLDGQPGRGRHRLHEVWIVQDGAVVHEG